MDDTGQVGRWRWVGLGERVVHRCMSRSTKVPVRFRASFRTHTGITHYEETHFIHPHPGVVHNFPMAVGAHVYDFVSLCKKKEENTSHSYAKGAWANQGILVSSLNNRWYM